MTVWKISAVVSLLVNADNEGEALREAKRVWPKGISHTARCEYCPKCPKCGSRGDWNSLANRFEFAHLDGCTKRDTRVFCSH